MPALADSGAGGLIPAHAGKTVAPRPSSIPFKAHPRSRGENPLVPEPLPQGEGSSPLTRGKRPVNHARPHFTGLIPAHAGKTGRSGGRAPDGWAHPRSRGENPPRCSGFRPPLGSSPLTRGKRHRGSAGPRAAGLIPAHAGKTRWPAPSTRSLPAHPRSRGENGRGYRPLSSGKGSSPLTRGKLNRRGRLQARTGLIPAHAGKTAHAWIGPRPAEAHPRSRGENLPSAARSPWTRGSSPLTRGKLPPRRRRGGGKGLIPAHAGKTRCFSRYSLDRWAHPRSRGENLSR